MGGGGARKSSPDKKNRDIKPRLNSVKKLTVFGSRR